MKQRPAMIIATVLTAFVLVIVGGVIARLSAAPAGTSASGAPTPGVDPALIATYQQRELEYQRLLEQANDNTTKANEQLATAMAALTAEPGGAAPPAAPPPVEPLPPLADPFSGAGQAADPLPPVEAAPPAAAEAPPAAAPQRISADQAAAAARAYVGGGAVERVKLEEEHGALVYEVRFTNDSRVYVDPLSGAVVYAKLADAPAATGGDAAPPDDNGGDRDGDDDDNSGSGGDRDDDDDDRDRDDDDDD